MVELGHLTALDGTVDLDALDRMLDQLEEPDQRWLRGSVLRRSLEHAPLGRAPDVPAVRRWSDAAVSAMGETAAVERGSVRPSRDVTRISAALAGAMRCPEPEPYVALVDTLIGARLAAPDGHVGLMEVGALIGLQVAGDLLGDAKELGATLATSRATFDAVADQGVSLGAARFAPALHLATATIEAAWHARGDDDAARDGVLAAIDANGDRDVTRSLAVWEAEVHTDAVLRLIRGARHLLAAEDAALEAVTAASQPGPEERGSWRVGLEISRVLLWDVASSKPGGEGALDQADQVLRRLVDAALDERALRHTAWEMLELVPALHHAGMRMLLEGSDADAERLGSELGGVVSEGLARMSPELRDGDAAELGLLAVVRDALRTADAEGMTAIVASAEARQRWLLALATRSEAYTPELRFLTRALVGRGLAESDLASGLGWLDLAAADGDDPRVSEVLYGLDLLRAAAFASDPARHPEALAALDAALSVGEQTAACGICHEVEATRPVRAWLLAQAGRHDEADAELRTYLSTVAEGGPTEGLLRCEIIAKQPGVSLNLTVERGLQSVVLDHDDDGSLSVGGGYESAARPLTSTTCTSRSVPAFRHDVVLRAALLRAVFQMRAERDAGAALADAVRLAERLRSGSEITLPRALAAGLESSREAAPVELLAWTSAMAFARGHLSSAEQLREIAGQLEGGEPIDLGDAPPAELRGLGLEDRAPLVAAWLGASAERLREALATTPGVRADAVPVAMARLQRDPGLAALRSPGSAVWAAQLAGMKRLAALARQPIDARADAAAIEGLARVGAYAEAAQLSVDLAAEHAAGRRLPEAIAALQHGRRAIPPEVAPHASIGLLLREGAAQPNLEWALTVAAVYPHVLGTLSPDDQLTLGLSAATVLVGTDRYAPLDTLATHLQDMSARSIDASEPISAQIEWLALAAAAAAGRIDGPALERARARIAAEPETPLVVHDLVDA